MWYNHLNELTLQKIILNLIKLLSKFLTFITVFKNLSCIKVASSGSP